MSLDDEWLSFKLREKNIFHLGGGRSIEGNTGKLVTQLEKEEPKRDIDYDTAKDPDTYKLTISTKTKVLFLSDTIDIQNVFWKIPVMDYWRHTNGVIKKQMKVVSKTPDEFAKYQENLVGLGYHHENIIKQINNPDARSIKFKDERKITIGVTKKDITSFRGKIKNAFYNCFAMIVRFRICDEIQSENQEENIDPMLFREIHVKVFNTGKMEIPGVVNPRVFQFVKSMVLDILLQATQNSSLSYVENGQKDHVLINSNFNCGFYINREKLHAIMNSSKYGIESSFDPCSYPGVKCKFYFNNALGLDSETQKGTIMIEDRGMKLSALVDSKKYTEISFMIFRTGSCLIVGNCTEETLRFIFHFISELLNRERLNIYVMNEVPVIKNKKTKPKCIIIENSHS